MIHRDDDHPSNPTIDAPSWREPGPGSPVAAPQDTTTVRRSPYATTQDATTRPDPAPDAIHPPGPPIRRVQQFALLERIAAGGMGEVFAAVDEQLGRKVALQLVAAQTRGDRAREPLSREAHALARLSHPNVVTIYDVGTLPDGGVFIVMELVSGQTLRTWQRAHRGAWRDIVAAYADAGRGLAAAHRSGIVHRDFNPDNVLVGDDGRVRVADFGLALADDAALRAAVIPAAETPVAEPARAPIADASAALPAVDVTAGSSPARRSGSLFARASASLRRVEASAAIPLVELNAALRADAPPAKRTGEPPAKLADASAALPATESSAGSPASEASAALPFADIAAASAATEASAALPLAEMSAAWPFPETNTGLAGEVTSAALPAEAAPASAFDEPRAASRFLEPDPARSRGDTRATRPGIAPGVASPRREPGRSRAGGAHAASSRDEISAALSRIGTSTAWSRPATAAARPDTDARTAWSHDEISAAEGDDPGATLPPVIEESAAMAPLPEHSEPAFQDPDADPTGVDVSAALLRLDTSTALSSRDSSPALPAAERSAGRSGTEASTGFFRIESPAPRSRHWRDRDRQATWPSATDAAASSSAGSTAGPHSAAGTRSTTSGNAAGNADNAVRDAVEIPPYAAVDNASLGPTADFESTLDLDTDLLPPGQLPRRTAAGGLVGTPSYLAPEQLAGTPVDARADQYSFCVALYEALHDERPSPSAAPRSPRSADARYPRWLTDLLQRGLSPDPDKRFATMDALLVGLTRGRERSRRRTAGAIALGAILAATIAVVMVRSSAQPPPCPLATDELTGVWDPGTRQRSQDAILGTGTPLASSMWTATAAAFDRYADRWLAAQQAACEASHVRHVPSADLPDGRMECLASRKRSLAAAAATLQHRPAHAVTHAREIVDGLGDLEPCTRAPSQPTHD